LVELAETRIMLQAAGTGVRHAYLFSGPVQTNALGLRVGDAVAVLLRGRGNPFRDPVAAVERILPVADLRLRVYDWERAIEPGALGQGPGCWLAGRPANVELCFLSTSDAVAMRIGDDGRLACAARLAPAGDGDRWAVTAPPTCSGSARWTLAGLRCDAAAQSCTLAVADRASEERLAMTRR
jgi:hypothetical protein